MVASKPIIVFLESLLPVLCTIFFSSHWLPSHITIIKTMSKRQDHDVTSADAPVLTKITRCDGTQSIFSTTLSGSPVLPVAMEVNGSKQQEEFEDPDTPLTLCEKVKVTSLIIFLYGMFVIAAILASIYN